MSGWPPIPEEGLSEVLKRWSGRGGLLDALAVPDDTLAASAWTARDVSARANRVLMARVAPSVERWPDRATLWLDLLPAARRHETVALPHPFSGVSWSKSMIRSGWPPKVFIGRETRRGADMMLATTLKWTSERLVGAAADASRMFPDATSGIGPQLGAAATVLGHEVLATAGSIAPGQNELRAIRREGAPWSAVAEVAEELLLLETSLAAYVAQLLMPDEEIRWRLFHLGVLGLTLRSLSHAGCTITSLRPLSAASPSPAYRVTHADGAEFDLWFEASGVWRHLGQSSPYQEATTGVTGVNRSLGADILLMSPAGQVMILECKYSSSPEFVARAGYYQAVAYAAEAKARFACEVVSLAVGPEGVVSMPGFTTLQSGVVGVIPPSALPAAITEFIAR